MMAHLTALLAIHTRQDLKLFEPKTMCPIMAVRDREER
jgi:hypothetical protein